MCVAVVAMACAKEDNNITTPAESKAPATIYASIAGDSRVELQWENATTPKTYWSVGDAISIFDCTDEDGYNHKYVNNSTEATRNAEFSHVERCIEECKEGGTALDDPSTKNIAIYPFSKNYSTPSGNNVSVFLTPTQTFVGSNTYCPNANIMVATAEPGSNSYSFKNMLGYLRVTLKGSATITDITLQGNNNEYLTGYISIDCNGEKPAIELPEEYTNPQYITIDCGEGVELNNEDGISFIFVVPPQTFAEGFTITTTTIDGKLGMIKTSKEIVVERNKITPMAAISFTPLMGNKTAGQAVKGDLALLDGSFVSINDIDGWSYEQKSKIAGIVFWTTKDTDLTDDTRVTPAKLSDDKIMSADYPSCNHGLIVALSNISSYSNWSDDRTDNAVANWQTSTFDATDKGNYLAINGPINYISGYQKTKLLKAYNKYCTDNSEGGKIVTPVSSLESWNVQAPANTTGWYIPSPKELHMLYYKDVDNIFYAHNNGATPETRTLIDELLSSLGATTLGENNYWSSMEGSLVDGENMYGAIRVHFSNGFPHGYRKDFGDHGRYYGHVRAICAF